MGEENVGNQTGDQGKDTVAKADFEAKTAELDKAKQELEDMRLEVFSPEYMAFLDAKDNKGKEKVEDKKPPLEGIDFEKMSKKEILDLATKQAEANLQIKIDAAKNDAVSTVSKETRAREVASFARSHEDFETYRPIMYGISLDPKNKDLSLDELYNKSKEHVARIHTAPSAEEKARQARLSTEKPGGDSQSFEKYKKMSAEDTAKDSLQEVKDKLGPIPSA